MIKKGQMVFFFFIFLSLSRITSLFADDPSILPVETDDDSLTLPVEPIDHLQENKKLLKKRSFLHKNLKGKTVSTKCIGDDCPCSHKDGRDDNVTTQDECDCENCDDEDCPCEPCVGEDCITPQQDDSLE